MALPARLRARHPSAEASGPPASALRPSGLVVSSGANAWASGTQAGGQAAGPLRQGRGEPRGGSQNVAAVVLALTALELHQGISMPKTDELWTLHAASTVVCLLSRQLLWYFSVSEYKTQGLPYDAKDSAMLTATEEKVTLSPRSDGQAVSGLG
eukprot:SM000132S26876  [mRNA]  locus=s132:91014:91669:- [translate_table: standard]